MSHIHFIGIGGAGIGPLAQVALQAGYTVSGSDLKNSAYIDYLKSHGIEDIQIGESEAILRKVNSIQPIDWVVFTSALVVNDQNPAVLNAANELGIKMSKRDEFTNQLIDEHDLKLIAIAGTHGKTTTTAMTVWLFKQLNIPLSYILPAKVSFGDMGVFNKESEYFVYEADEYDYNFLAFKPEFSLITGISWDHHEIFKTEYEYKQAFKKFILQSEETLMWKKDASLLEVNPDTFKVAIDVLDEEDGLIGGIKLDGIYNRRDGYLAAKLLDMIAETGRTLSEIIALLNKFPGLSRRMEELVINLYSDYAHTPEKIKAAMDVAKDMTMNSGQKIVVLYEPLTNRRQTYIKDDYKDCFNGASKVYWLDSYLARENPGTPIIAPKELIKGLNDPSIAESAKRDEKLKAIIQNHLNNGDMVIGMAGGGGDSLDDWLRDQFVALS